MAVYEEYRDHLPEVFAKRAQHYFIEMDRVEKGIEAWKHGDLETFGKLVFASGYSSIHDWETGSPELKASMRFQNMFLVSTAVGSVAQALKGVAWLSLIQHIRKR